VHCQNQHIYVTSKDKEILEDEKAAFIYCYNVTVYLLPITYYYEDTNTSHIMKSVWDKRFYATVQPDF